MTKAQINLMTGLVFAVTILISCNKDCERCKCYTDDQHLILQECEDEEDLEEIYRCSKSRLLQQVYMNVKYPVEAREHDIQGTVIIGFTIDEKGELNNFRIVKDSLGYGLGEAGLEGAKALNELEICPYRENCRPYKYEFQLPIKFKLM